MIAAESSIAAPAIALASIVVILVASSVMFWVLVRRETSHRLRVALREWAGDAGFRLHDEPPAVMPPPLDAIAKSNPRPRLCLSNRQTTLLQFVTESSFSDASARHPSDLAATVAGRAPSSPHGPRWNVLVRRLATTWPPTGARPAHASASLLDLFSLGSFPLLGNSERFVIYGADSTAAEALADSAARALLPPDIGLLLHGGCMALDFSGRPFDAIEFNRMLALADQLVGHLPAPRK